MNSNSRTDAIFRRIVAKHTIVKKISIVREANVIGMYNLEMRVTVEMD